MILVLEIILLDILLCRSLHIVEGLCGLLIRTIGSTTLAGVDFYFPLFVDLFALSRNKALASII